MDPATLGGQAGRFEDCGIDLRPNGSQIAEKKRTQASFAPVGKEDISEKQDIPQFAQHTQLAMSLA